ncbi:MAG TPA: hypothetical protein VIF15_06755 [Polyangiaceae bacterium]
MVLRFGGVQYEGLSQTVTEVQTAVNGTMQYRVNVAAALTGSKPGLCTIAVSSAAEAERYKLDLLNDHTMSLTCTVSHTVTTDPTAGVFALINTVSPSAGDSLSIESH